MTQCNMASVWHIHIGLAPLHMGPQSGIIHGFIYRCEMPDCTAALTGAGSAGSITDPGTDWGQDVLEWALL